MSVTRERDTGLIVFLLPGPFDEGTLVALISAIGLAPPEAPLVIDLFSTGTLHEDGIRILREAVAARSGTVTFKHAGPWHQQLLAQCA